MKGRLSDQVGSEPTRTGSELFVIVASRMFLTVRVWPHFARQEVKVQPVRNEIAGQEVKAKATAMMAATACSLDFLSATELINMTMTKVNCVFPRGARHTDMEKGQQGRGAFKTLAPRRFSFVESTEKNKMNRRGKIPSAFTAVAANGVLIHFLLLLLPQHLHIFN